MKVTAGLAIVTIFLCAPLSSQTAGPAALVEWSIKRGPGAPPSQPVPPAAQAIHDDALRAPARLVQSYGKTEIWLRPLSGGALAAAAFNRGERPVQADLVWKELAITGQPPVLDALSGEAIGKVHGGFAVKLPPGGAALFRVEPSPTKSTPVRPKEIPK